MTTPVRYIAHLATDRVSHVVAGFVTIDDQGRPVHREALGHTELQAHGWNHTLEDAAAAAALSRAAEDALARLGFERADDDVQWHAEAQPNGRWGTTAGAELRPAAA